MLSANLFIYIIIIIIIRKACLPLWCPFRYRCPNRSCLGKRESWPISVAVMKQKETKMSDWAQMVGGERIYLPLWKRGYTNKTQQTSAQTFFKLPFKVQISTTLQSGMYLSQMTLMPLLISAALKKKKINKWIFHLWERLGLKCLCFAFTVTELQISIAAENFLVE